jgi:hypothetical protein
MKHLPNIAGGLLGFMFFAFALIAAFLLWTERKAFAGLLR